MTKVAFISHGHPDLSKGGAEVASYNLFRALKKMDEFECLYIARTENKSHGGSTFSLRGDDLLLHTAIDDWFTLSNSRLKPLFTDLGKLLRQFSPDVVHVHHYAHIGIELFAAIKQAVPNAKLVFTIHEFMAICMHNGQMVKKPSLKLCHQATPSDCHECFPQHTPSDFFLRKSYLQDQFDHVDAFVSPSEFLAERYIEWGLPRAKMHVIENVLPTAQKCLPRPLNSGEKRTKLAFFGQINPYKGLDILLQAMALLSPEAKSRVTLDIHGANLDRQTDDIKEKFTHLLAQVGENVAMRGQYEAHQMPALLKEIDWMVIPSIWWENSPVVIQEAKAHGRPVIGANIGGMKEKIEDICGLTFEARSPSSLAKVIEKAIEPACYDEWYARLSGNDNVLAQHLQFINGLLS